MVYGLKNIMWFSEEKVLEVVMFTIKAYKNYVSLLNAYKILKLPGLGVKH